MNETEKPVEYYLPEKISVNKDGEKEYMTKQGMLIKVIRKKEYLSGVGLVVYYQIHKPDGNMLSPLTTKGIKNFIERN